MSEKKSFWERLFNGGGCSCGMSLEEEPAPRKQPSKVGREEGVYERAMVEKYEKAD